MVSIICMLMHTDNIRIPTYICNHSAAPISPPGIELAHKWIYPGAEQGRMTEHQRIIVGRATGCNGAREQSSMIYIETSPVTPSLLEAARSLCTPHRRA